MAQITDALRQIKQAEDKADKLRQDARREAWDIVKSVEEALQAQDKDFQRDIRHSQLTALAKARQEAQAQVDDKLQKLSKSLAQNADADKDALLKARDYIVKAVLDDGHR